MSQNEEGNLPGVVGLVSLADTGCNAPVYEPRFTVKKGTLVAFADVWNPAWVGVIAEEDYKFARYERAIPFDSGALYEFRLDGGLLMRVESKEVVLSTVAQAFQANKQRKKRKPRRKAAQRKLQSPLRIAKQMAKRFKGKGSKRA